MTFKFPTGRRRGVVQEEQIFTFESDSSDDKEPGIIQGQKARSLLEWYVAKALWRLNYEFIYQHPLFGGTSRRGGFVIDFIVDPHGFMIPLEVQGKRWHTGNFASTERMREAIVEKKLGVKLRYVWENQLTSEEAAYQAVKAVLR